MTFQRIFSTVLFFALIGSLQAQLKTTAVSVFKNKTAFFLKSGTVPTQSSTWTVYGDTIPKALNGTLWLSSPTNDFKMVKAYQKEVKTKEKGLAKNFSSLLALNNGKKASLHFRDTSYTGTVIFTKIPEKEKPLAPVLTAPLFALKLDNGKTLIFTQAQINQVLRVEFEEDPDFLYDYTYSKKMPALQVDFKSSTSNQPMSMMYLTTGLAWKPDYKIELLEDTKAKLSLRATVINEAEDIKTNQLNLVAGVPNFRYATQASDLINFLNIMPAPQIQPGFANSAFNTRVEEIAYNDVAPFSPPTAPRPNNNGGPNNFSEATAMEDLYFYTLKDIDLKKGERAFFDIFSIETEIEHVYESILKPNNIQYAVQYSFLEKTNPVLHTIKLTNNSPYTWTAAPAFVLKNDKKQKAPISQDLLNYTSKKDDVSVKLTEAPDVSVAFIEKESNRTARAKSRQQGSYTYYYDLVTVETEVTVHNYKSKKIRLDLKRTLTGEAVETNVPWKLAPRVEFGYNYNKKTDVCWEMTLEPGEEKIIKYTYTFYTTQHH